MSDLRCVQRVRQRFDTALVQGSHEFITFGAQLIDSMREHIVTCQKKRFSSRHGEKEGEIVLCRGSCDEWLLEKKHELDCTMGFMVECHDSAGPTPVCELSTPNLLGRCTDSTRVSRTGQC